MIFRLLLIDNRSDHGDLLCDVLSTSHNIYLEKNALEYVLDYLLKGRSCNTEKRRIWLNLELAKKLPQCLEYILVHELVHMHERHNNDRLRGFMDDFLPSWRSSREALKRDPLGHEDWIY
jgi:hypothetical protein